jgi:hypothetical protein
VPVGEGGRESEWRVCLSGRKWKREQEREFERRKAEEHMTRQGEGVEEGAGEEA